MTTKLNQAFETLRQLPEERQDEWAELIAEAEQRPASAYAAEQLAAIDEGIADAKTGRFVSDEEVNALFARFRAA